MTAGLWGLSWLDYLVIVVYFAVTLTLGLRAGRRRMGSQEEFFLFTLGAGLPDDEVAYLHQVIKRALTG